MRDDIPQAKYVMTNRKITEDIYNQAFKDAKEYYGFFEKAIDLYSQLPNIGQASHFIWRQLRDKDMSNGYKKEFIRE